MAVVDGQSFTIETEYSIKYTNREPVPIPEIVSSLQSLERMIRRTPVFLEKAYGGISIIEVEVYVAALEAGSLSETFLIKYVFKGQENYEQAKAVWDKIMEDNSAVRTVVAMGISAMITYGVIQALGNGTSGTHIEAYNSNIITIGTVGDLKGSDVPAILDSISDKKQLAKDAVNTVKPAKADPQAQIQMAGMDVLTIGHQFIASAPDEYSPPIPEERDEKYSNVEIQVFASDRDRTDSGWAGIVPGVVDKRVKFILGEGVDPKKMHGRIAMRADIVVVSRFDKSKKAYEPKSVEIRAVN